MFDETSLNGITIFGVVFPERQKSEITADSLHNIVFGCHANVMPPIVNETLTVHEIASRSRSTSLLKQSTLKFYAKMFPSIMANTFYGRIAKVLLGDY